MNRKGPVEIIEEVVARFAEATMSDSGARWSGFEHTLHLLLESIPVMKTESMRNDLIRSYMMRLMVFALHWVIDNDAKSTHPNAVAIQKRTAAYVQRRLVEKMYLEEEEPT